MRATIANRDGGHVGGDGGVFGTPEEASDAPHEVEATLDSTEHIVQAGVARGHICMTSRSPWQTRQVRRLDMLNNASSHAWFVDTP